MTTGSPDHTIPSKSEIYPLINEAIMKKWQQQWNNTLTGHIYQSIQPNIQRRARQYSSNRKIDVIFTKLRLGHNGFKHHRKYVIINTLNQLTTFSLTAKPTRTQDVSWRQPCLTQESVACVTLNNLVFLPPTHMDSVVGALMKFLKDTEYMDSIKVLHYKVYTHQ